MMRLVCWLRRRHTWDLLFPETARSVKDRGPLYKFWTQYKFCTTCEIKRIIPLLLLALFLASCAPQDDPLPAAPPVITIDPVKEIMKKEAILEETDITSHADGEAPDFLKIFEAVDRARKVLATLDARALEIPMGYFHYFRPVLIKDALEPRFIGPDGSAVQAIYDSNNNIILYSEEPDIYCEVFHGMWKKLHPETLQWTVIGHGAEIAADGTTDPLMTECWIQVETHHE